MGIMATTGRTRAAKLDAVCAEAVDLARQAAVDTAGVLGVGEHLGCDAEAERAVTHRFACPHPGYLGWQWSVTVVRAARAKQATINEIVLLPGDGALTAANWVPWAERIEPGDVGPGMLMPTPDDDPRLEPGYTGGEGAEDPDPAEASQIRAVVSELGLGRERVLSLAGRDEAAERWIDGTGGPDNQLSKQAPATCVTCGFFVRLRGSLGREFGVCSNAYSPSDAHVVSVGHGCGAHSSVPEPERASELPPPVWDTVAWDRTGLFD
jgi:hypothetical protein